MAGRLVWGLSAKVYRPLRVHCLVPMTGCWCFSVRVNTLKRRVAISLPVCVLNCRTSPIYTRQALPRQIRAFAITDPGPGPGGVIAPCNDPRFGVLLGMGDLSVKYRGTAPSIPRPSISTLLPVTRPAAAVVYTPLLTHIRTLHQSECHSISPPDIVRRSSALPRVHATSREVTPHYLPHPAAVD